MIALEITRDRRGKHQQT